MSKGKISAVCKWVLPLVPAYCLVVLAAVLLLYGAAMIPQESVRQNFVRSADTLCENDVFFHVQEGVFPSFIDRYADSILLNIAWNLRPDPGSLMWTAYYTDEYQNENENLYASVNEDLSANQEYVRYWHGSAAVVRILHRALDIRSIYLLHGIILVVLTILLLILLIRRKMLIEASALSVGLIGVSIWFVPLSLEYYWTFLCMLLASVLILILEEKGKAGWIPVLLLVTGMVTAYLDFLSTETITLTVPLLLLYRQRLGRESRQQNKRDIGQKTGTHNKSDSSLKEMQSAGITSYLVYCLIWALGYVGMWTTKWMLAACITKENVIPYIKGHVAERIGTQTPVLKLPIHLLTTLKRNLQGLFPFGYGAAGIVCGIGILLVLAYVAYVFHGKQKPGGSMILYGLLIAIPYVRYLVLHDHAYLHAFFTYRAQLVVIMVIWILFCETTDLSEIKNLMKRRFFKK
ncbi:MAG: hypothetical protein K6E18_03495 [Lachnospiraceae bacterium]|nr:hypothetical protein [Lachnospiraceae bacterium]